MANLNVIMSYTLQDDDGERTAYPYYATVSDADALSAIQAESDGLATLLDAITDGQIVKQRLIVEFPVTGGLKSAPVAGSEIEVTGLFTYPLTALPGKVFSQDIPTFKRALFVGNKINLSDTDVAAWTDASESTGSTPGQNNLWSSTLQEVRTGRKTFRKHRKQTERT
jgi:hypothetical protein